MVAIAKLAGIAAVLSTALAADGIKLYHEDDLAVTACQSLLKKTAIFTLAKDGGYCDTGNQPALGSMATCLKMSPHQGGINYFIKSCASKNLTLEEFDASYTNASKYWVTNTTAYPGFSLKKPFYLPVKSSQKVVTGAYDSTLGRWYNYNRSHFYGWALVSFWFFLVCMAGLGRLSFWVAPKLVHSFNGKISNAVRKYITIPALFGRKNSQEGVLFKVFDFIIPSRWETIIIVSWLLMALAMNIANIHHDSPNIVWTVESAEIGRKIADRSGIICLYLIPCLILFGGRNNFMEWISGWTQARFLIMHRWIGFAATIEMILHTVGMIYNGKGTGSFTRRNAKTYVRFGYVAVGAAIVMCIHSLAVLRKRQYELFLMFHNILAIVFIIGAWRHLDVSAGFGMYMYAATAVWCFDKFVRLVRLSVFGIRTADVQLIADETLKVKIPRPSYWKPGPLQHAYIYFLRSSCFWQSHPFTVIDSVAEKNTITFYIKVKGGMTHGLYKYLSTQPDQRASIKCSVEGPYGSRQPLQHYKSVSYFTGGNGIPGLYSSALALGSKNSTKSATQNIKLYWVIRHWKSIEWFYEELKKLEHTTVKTIVYVTAFHTPLDQCFIDKFEDQSSAEEKKSDDEDKDSEMSHVYNLMDKLSHVEFRSGRPNVTEVVLQDINESAGSVAFLACGHNTFVDETRKVVAENLPEGKRVDFYDQLQHW